MIASSFHFSKILEMIDKTEISREPYKVALVHYAFYKPHLLHELFIVLQIISMKQAAQHTFKMS